MILRPKLSASILGANLCRLENEVQRVMEYGIHWIHVDVMDGHFVPNFGFGTATLESLKSNFQENIFLDVHLMVEKPELWIKKFIDCGADQLTFHIEASKEDPMGLIESIKERKKRAGIAIKPSTNLDTVMKLLPYVDMALVMTVEPGFGGQKMIMNTLEKVQTIRENFQHLDIQVDGGLTTQTAPLAAKAGANIIVAGTSIFQSNDLQNTISCMMQSFES